MTDRRVREDPRRGQCTAEDCQRFVFARGWCQKHYRRWQKTGVTSLLSTGERFWRKVDKTDGECWNWTASTRNGYGTASFQGRHEYAHRVAYRLTHGAIPDALVIRHRCDNRLCVRPDHLEVGTKADNSRDMVERGRSAPNPRALNAFCPNGHPFDAGNTYWWNNARQCKTCKAEWQRRNRDCRSSVAMPLCGDSA